jgi:hypothetical protein
MLQPSAVTVTEVCLAGVSENCTFCKRGLYSNDETWTAFTGGGCIDGAKERTPKTLRAFTDISWRSPFSQGEGGKLESLSLIEGFSDDQFEIYFCSPACLRSFFMSKVDQLEQQIGGWYEEQMRYILDTSARPVAIQEWRRYFGCSLEEAEAAIARIDKS